MAMETLKVSHSMVGKSLIPVILKVKATTDAPEEFARLKKDHPLTDYTFEELTTHLEGLTGETMADILLLCGKDDSVENARLILHYTIIQANLVGGPRGKILATPSASSSSVTTSAALHVPPVSPAVATTSVTNSSSTGNSSKGNTVPSVEVDLAIRVKQMEDKMDIISNKSVDKQVDECLSHVRILSARPNLTQGHVFPAAIETLVTIATKLSHNDAEYFSKAYVHCKKYEDSKDLCSLALKLFGSAEDKKLANIVADWVKGKKYEVASPRKTVSVEIDSGKDNRDLVASGVIPPGVNLPNGFNPYVLVVLILMPRVVCL